MPETITLKDLEHIEQAAPFFILESDSQFIAEARLKVPAMAATLREAMRLLEILEIRCYRCHGAGVIIERTGTRLETDSAEEDQLRNRRIADCPQCKNAPQQARMLVKRFKGEA